MEGVHRYPALVAFIAFSLGILAGYKIGIAAIAVVSGTLVILIILTKELFYLHFFMIFFFLGMVRMYQFRQNETKAELIGPVHMRVQVINEGVGKIQINGVPLDGKVYISKWIEALPGEEFKAVGFLKPIDGENGFERYLLNNGINWYLRVKHYEGIQRSGFRGEVLSYIRKVLDSLLDDRESREFARAILIGERRGVPRRVKEAMKKTGTLHVLALSGLHVGLIFTIFFLLLRFLRLRKKVAMVGAMLLVISYLNMIGFKVSLFRAVILLMSFCIGCLVQRRNYSLNSLGFAGFISLLLDPRGLFDVSFQLSYSATFGILFFYPLINQFCRKRLSRLLIRPLLVSISAQLFTAPIAVARFGGVSLLAPLFNLVAVPLLWLILAWLITGVTFSIFSMEFAKPYCFLAGKAIWIFMNTVSIGDKFCSGFVEMRTTAISQVIIYYCLLVATGMILRKKNK